MYRAFILNVLFSDICSIFNDKQRLLACENIFKHIHK